DRDLIAHERSRPDMNGLDSGDAFALLLRDEHKVLIASGIVDECVDRYAYLMTIRGFVGDADGCNHSRSQLQGRIVDGDNNLERWRLRGGRGRHRRDLPL